MSDEDIIEANRECNLLGNEGVAFQGGLAFLSFFVLVLKRQRERPKRSLRIWFMDTSKQGFSATTAHTLNLALAYWLSSKQTEQDADSCVWYFVTLVFDTTIGVFISILLLLLMEKLFDTCRCDRLKSGNYFKMVANTDPLTSARKPQKLEIDCLAWVLQVIIWICIVTVAKVILGYVQHLLSPLFIAFVKLHFDQISHFPTLKLLIVLVITPTVGNAFQFWFSDNFLKKRDFSKGDSLVLQGGFFDEENSTQESSFDKDDNKGPKPVTVQIELGSTNFKAKNPELAESA